MAKSSCEKKGQWRYLMCENNPVLTWQPFEYVLKQQAVRRQLTIITFPWSKIGKRKKNKLCRGPCVEQSVKTGLCS